MLLVISISLLAAVALGAATWIISGRMKRPDPTAPRVEPKAVEQAVDHSPGLRRFFAARRKAAATTELAMAGALALALAATVGVGALLLMIHTNSGLARWDSSAARWGASHATTTSTNFLRVVTQLGGTLVIVAVCVLVAAIETWRTRSRSVVGFIAAVLIGITAIANVTKLIVGRARPNVDRLVGFSGTSFPSGHSATAAAVYAGLAMLIGRRRSPRTRRLLAAVAVGIAGTVGATRVLLGVHWNTDVIAGLLIGWAWFAVCSIAFGGRYLHFGAPVAQAERAAGSAPSDLTADVQNRREATAIDIRP